MEAIWTPKQASASNYQVDKFRIALNIKNSLNLETYWDLQRFSVDHLDEFWSFFADYANIIWHSRPQTAFKSATDSANPFIESKWFSGSTLNFAENLLPDLSDENIRIVSYIEGLKESKSYSGREIYSRVYHLSGWLRDQGVVKGDRVAGIVSNTAESIIAMLATTSIGAIWTSCSPDFGPSSIIERFSQVEPKIIFCVASYSYNGKKFDCGEKLSKVLSQLPSVCHSVSIDPFAESLTSSHSPMSYEFDRVSSGTLPQNAQMNFESVDFDHPLYIMYSSGTTGVPKCIVHRTGGTLIQHKKELLLHCDLSAGKRLLFFTTCGWMMWNWMVSGLSTGASLVLYEGSPAYGEADHLWKIVADSKTQVFGTSPKYLAACAQGGSQLFRKFDLSELEMVLSTGSPLLPEQFKWFYRDQNADIPLVSISGGTDIISCFMLGVPGLPVFAGELQAPGLGMEVDCFDLDGNSLDQSKGELVCLKPFPSAPIYFWNDPSQRRYLKSYFSRFPNIWCHGDFIEKRSSGGFLVHGRSDTTLNTGGIRIGTAEIYRQVESDPEIVDSLVVDMSNEGDSAIVLLLKLRELSKLDQNKRAALKKNIRTNLSPRHVPRFIEQVDDIPYTRSGKKLEIAAREILSGRKIDNISAIANPDCLAQYTQLRKQLLQKW